MLTDQLHTINLARSISMLIVIGIKTFIPFSVRMGIDDIRSRYNKTKKYSESEKVQYIMNGNNMYKNFDAHKQVDWSTTTQEQSDNSIR